MSPRKQKIYIAIIVICFSLTGFILYKTLFPAVQTTPEDLPTISQVPNAGTSQPVSTTTDSNGRAVYGAPRVFPDNIQFDWTVMEMDSFKESVPVSGIVLTPADTSRDNPFAPY